MRLLTKPQMPRGFPRNAERSLVSVIKGLILPPPWQPSSITNERGSAPRHATRRRDTSTWHRHRCPFYASWPNITRGGNGSNSRRLGNRSGDCCYCACAAIVPVRLLYVRDYPVRLLYVHDYRVRLSCESIVCGYCVCAVVAVTRSLYVCHYYVRWMQRSCSLVFRLLIG